MEKLRVLYPVQSEERLTIDERSSIIALRSVNIEPVPVSLNTPEGIRNSRRRTTAGLYIGGGGDISPRMYHHPQHSKVSGVVASLDALQVKELKFAAAAGLPILGICRGGQALNVAFGGDLIQHLPDTVDEPHGVSIQVEDSQSKRAYHGVHIQPATRAREIFETGWIPNVISLHHQAVGKLGNGLVASGWSSHGVVEVIESEDPEIFQMGLQFHAELDERAMGQIVNPRVIFMRFAEAVNKIAPIGKRRAA